MLQMSNTVTSPLNPLPPAQTDSLTRSIGKQHESHQ